MTLFRDAFNTNARLARERKYQIACSSRRQNRQKDMSRGKSVYGRYALRNYLRSRLRQKLGQS